MAKGTKENKVEQQRISFKEDCRRMMAKGIGREEIIKRLAQRYSEEKKADSDYALKRAQMIFRMVRREAIK